MNFNAHPGGHKVNVTTRMCGELDVVVTTENTGQQTSKNFTKLCELVYSESAINAGWITQRWTCVSKQMPIYLKIAQINIIIDLKSCLWPPEGSKFKFTLF